MLRRKRHPITADGRELTPEVIDEIVKEIEDADPADFVKQPWDGSTVRVRRLHWVECRLLDFGDSVRWKREAAVKALRRFAREVRRHRKAKV